MKKILLFIFLLGLNLQMIAQVTIQGTVKSATDESTLPGVSILLKGTSTGTVTGLNGHYSISVPKTGTLVFSYVGFKSQEIPIGNQKTINVNLSSSSVGLNELVVVGYGSQKITNVSGAISMVKASDIALQKPVMAEEALQGQASGVTVIQNGSPGSTPTVLIRGIPSFTGTNPLVIVDGVPQSLDDLNAIDPSDIKSINVLKDAATTAIYGVKGGNGVIVVTTKSGRKNQKAQFTFNSYYGQQQVMNKVGVLNATEYATMINEGSVTAGGGLIFPNPSKLGAGTNWQDQIFKKAGISSNNITARGGGKNMDYFLSAGYLSQGGIVGGADKSNFKRANFTANLNFQLTKKLKLALYTSYVNLSSKGVQENSFNSVIGSALNFDPTVPVLNTVPNTVGKYGFSNLILSEVYNPLTKLDNTYNKSNGNKLYGKVQLQYDILKNLKLTSRFGYSSWSQKGKSFVPLVFYGPLNVDNTMNADGTTVADKHNSVSEYSNANFNFTSETFTNYNFNIQGKHHFETVAGFSLSENTSSGVTISRQDVPFNSWTFADFISATGVNSSTNTAAQTASSYMGLTRRNLSYFGRVDYNYQEKYLASFSARRDGSIAFGPDNKFANFFAGSVGWIVSDEDFFKVNFINFLKIRGSYGSVGNENVSPQYVSIVTGGPSYGPSANSNGYTFGTVFYPGSTVNSFQNNSLSWEKQLQLDLGFDIRVFKSKVSISGDYFDKTVNGLLFVEASPLYAGTSLPVDANIGSTRSNGVDLSLGYNDVYAKDFKINTSITFSTANNLVTATNRDGTAIISGGTFFNGQSQTVTRFQKGFTPGYFYGYKTDGLFQTQAEINASPTQVGAAPGDIKYVDVNGDGVINALDKTNIGNPFPKFTLGWNLGFSYKNFDISVYTYASVGNDIYLAWERNGQYTNKLRSILARWTGPGTTNDARDPRYSFLDPNNNIRVSDRYVENGSFIKIKSLSIGYTVPRSLFNNKGFSKLRFYAQVKNLLTLTKYTGYDPEISGGILNTGVDLGSYPQARTFSVGLVMNY